MGCLSGGRSSLVWILRRRWRFILIMYRIIGDIPHCMGLGLQDRMGKGVCLTSFHLSCCWLIDSLDANEAFDWGHDSKLTDDPDDKFVDPYMRGDNPWPKQLPGFEDHLSNYYRTMRAFCRILARNIALSLNLNENYFDSVLTHPGCSALVAHYPPQKPKSRNFGLSAHTDAECELALT
jgi:hypothetical protein